MTKHPDSAKIRDIFTRLRNFVARINNPIVDMVHTGVDITPGTEEHSCGTVACHGGWLEFMRQTEADNVSVSIRNGGGICNKSEDLLLYTHGANWLAQELGFHNSVLLEAWARDNPLLWGNNGGGAMFCCEVAFGVHSKDVTVEHICDHWMAVADRIDAYNLLMSQKPVPRQSLRIAEILDIHEVYSAELELRLLRHFDELRLKTLKKLQDLTEVAEDFCIRVERGDVKPVHTCERFRQVLREEPNEK